MSLMGLISRLSESMDLFGNLEIQMSPLRPQLIIKPGTLSNPKVDGNVDKRMMFQLIDEQNDNKEVGVLLFEPSYIPDHCRIHLFAINSEFRHMGYGQEMLEECVKVVRLHGDKYVFGTTRASEFSAMTKFKGRVTIRGDTQYLRVN